MTNLVIRPRSYSPDLRRAAIALEHATWGPVGFLNYTAAHHNFYDDLLEEFADCQLCLVDPETDYPVAVACCVPVACSGPDELPAEGWDWMVERAAARRGGRANMLGALAISVPTVHRGKGHARTMIRALRDLSGRMGLDGLIAPVRPTRKDAHPLVPIGDYVNWVDDKGRIFDPWLRAHLSEGGRLVRPCERSMVVEEPLGFWETWAGRELEASGDFLIDGALVPISVDPTRRIGRYEEPNVWVAYGGGGSLH